MSIKRERQVMVAAGFTVLTALVLGLPFSPLRVWEDLKPGQASLLSQSRTNAGPYVRSQTMNPTPSGGKHSAHLQANTPEDLAVLKAAILRVAPFVSSALEETYPEGCTESLVNIHLIPDEKLNDRDVMVFTQDQPAGLEFFGLTQFLHNGLLAWSFICSDCSESVEDILIHELTHFHLHKCGVDEDQQDESMCHEMVEDFRTSRT